jgi:hypothetical protein
VIARRAGVEGEVWLAEGHKPSSGHGCGGNVVNGAWDKVGLPTVR